MQEGGTGGVALGAGRPAANAARRPAAGRRTAGIQCARAAGTRHASRSSRRTRRRGSTPRWPRSRGPTRSSSSTPAAPTPPPPSPARATDRVFVEGWPGFPQQKNRAADLATHDWILSIDADERVSPALAARDPRACSPRGPAARGYRIPRVTRAFGRELRATDWYPDWQLRLYDRRAGRWDETRTRARVGARRRRASATAARRAAPRRLPRPLASTSRRSIATRRSPPRPTPPAAATPRCCDRRPSAARLPAQLRPAPRLHRRHRRPGGLGDEQLVRLPEAGQAVGAPPAAGGVAPMLSLHIDTARTWRGGQNQALLTVLGLRGLGHRTVLVAHPQGELRRRAAEGLDLIGLAPRSELDLAAAWRLARVLKQTPAGKSSTRTIRTASPSPLPRSAIGGLDGQADAGRLAPRRLPAQAERAVAVEVPPGGGVPLRLRVHPPDPDRPGHPARAGADDPRGHRPRPRRRGAAGQRPRGVLAAAPTRRSSAASARWSSTRATATWCTPRRDIVRAVPDARVVILGEGDLRDELSRLIHELGLERHVLLPGFRPDVLSLLKALRRVRDAVDHRGPGHLDPRRHGLRARRWSPAPSAASRRSSSPR